MIKRWVNCGGLSSATSTVTVSAAICLTASPRSQQELRLKPTTASTQNQRGQLARIQIVVVDRRTRSGSRKERPAGPRDLRSEAQLVTDKDFLNSCQLCQETSGRASA